MAAAASKPKRSSSTDIAVVYVVEFLIALSYEFISPPTMRHLFA